MKIRCNQCKSVKDEIEFRVEDAVRKTCSTCRKKVLTYNSSHPEDRRQQIQNWKAVNKDYVKQMNEFYRTTTSFSREERTILKIANKTMKNKCGQHTTNGSGEMGKVCAVPKCGWKPLTFFGSNEFSVDRLSSICIRCFYVRSGIRNTIVHDINTKLKNLFSEPDNKVHNNIIPCLGCSISHFKKHIELLFKENMSWDKWGSYLENGDKKIGFHIDHVLPISCFDLTEPRELFLCFHWKNCQPLWGFENMKKKKYI